MTGWREVGSKLGQYSVAQVSGLIDKAAGMGIIGYCMFWGKAVGNGRFEKKQRGVGVLYGLVDSGRVSVWGHGHGIYHRVLCVLGKVMGSGCFGKNNGEWVSCMA